jgi:DNA-binding transcriptional LysR family regulator
MADRDYDLFAHIVASGSLSAAGRALGLSPAMVSKRLARLESRLGATLIARTTRRIALTPTGERFHADVVAILAAIQSAENRLSGEAKEPAGPLKVSAPTSFGRMHIAPYIGQFLSAYPSIDLELNLSDHFVDILENRVDVAVRITSSVDTGLYYRLLARNRRILCASPAYLAHHDVPATPRDLGKHRLLAAVGQLPWRLVSTQGGAVMIEGRSHVITDSSEVARELAIAGVGIAFRSIWDVSEELATGRLQRILPAYEGAHDVGIYALTHSANTSPAALAFSSFLEKTYSPLPPWEQHAAIA